MERGGQVVVVGLGVEALVGDGEREWGEGEERGSTECGCRFFFLVAWIGTLRCRFFFSPGEDLAMSSATPVSTPPALHHPVFSPHAFLISLSFPS